MTTFKRLEELTNYMYEKYLPSAFDDSLSFLQKVNKIIKYLNDIIALQNEVSEFVETTTETQNANIQGVRDDFEELKLWLEGEGAELHLTNILNDWDASGKLDDIINNQILSTKRDKTTLIELADLSQEVKTSMTGGSVAVVGDNMVLESNIVNRQVSPIKLKDYQAGKNLFNKANVTLDNYVRYDTGVLSANTTYNASEFIPINPSTQYTHNFSHQIAFYNASKVYISGVNTVGNGAVVSSFTTPANAVYVRVTLTKPYMDIYQLEMGNASTSYEPYGYYMPQLLGGINGSAPIKMNRLADYTISKNLYNLELGRDGYYVDYLNGSETANASYTVSDYFPVESSAQYVANKTIRMYAFYTDAKAFISGVQNLSSGVVITAPSNAKFMKVSFAIGDKSQFQIEKGAVSTSYISGAKYQLKNLTVDVSTGSNNNFLLFLPSEICIAVGRTIELYNSQVSWAGNIDNYHFKWECSIGKAYKKKWSCKGLIEKVGSYTLTCSVYDNAMVMVATATTTVKVVNFNVATPKKVLAIGDSLTNAKGWLAEVRSLSANKISYVGTRWNGDVQGGYLNHEGRSGVTAGWYLGNNTYTFESNGVSSANPFWNSGTSAFDYGYYKTQNSITPDVVQIFLGTNGISLDPAINVSNIKAIVDGIRVSDANIPIYVVFTLYRGDQNGIGNQLSSDGYSAGSGVWKLEEDRKVYNLMVELFSQLKNYSNLYFTPVSLTHDSENNFKATTPVPVNPRSTITELQDAEATHPSARPEGYLQMADIMFSTFAGHMS